MPRKNLIKGNTQDVIDSNIRTLKDAGYSHSRATRCALCHANKKHDKHAKSVAGKVASKGPALVAVKS